MPAGLEHVNITVSNPTRTAERLCALFDWHIRWKGAATHGGHTIHVGSDTSYVAVYTKGEAASATDKPPPDSYATTGALNHIGVLVEDLDRVEARVIRAGLKPYSHADYEPGRRFYFRDDDDIEFEVVSYASR